MMMEDDIFYNRLYDKLPDVFFKLCADGRIIFISGAVERLTGFSPDEIKAKGAFWELFSGSGQPVETMTNMLNEQGSAEGIELPIKTNNGSRWVSVNAWYFKEQEPSTIEGTLRDITKCKELQDNSEKLAAAGQLAATAAHEINNQLTSASLSIQIIMQKLSKSSTPEVITRKLEGLQRNIDKAVSVAKQLMPARPAQ
ncbi:MAG: PAS domain S-box protein [Nitrospirae bacterium]|nr:PAS domain S-box protein [Nitrospirota bacterium]